MHPPLTLKSRFVNWPIWKAIPNHIHKTSIRLSREHTRSFEMRKEATRFAQIERSFIKLQGSKGFGLLEVAGEQKGTTIGLVV